MYEESRGGVRWVLDELLDSTSLADEGRRMRSCVATYARWCRSGESAIFSLRRRDRSGALRSVLTVEVDPGESWVCQVRGRGNTRPRGLPLAIVRRWARLRSLRVLDEA